MIRHINGRISLVLPSAGTLNESSDLFRVMLYVDKQANGATVVNTDLIEDENDVMSFRKLENIGRFTILYDKFHTLNAPAGSGNGTAADSFIYQKFFTINKKVNIPLEFSSTAGAITEIRSNNIGLAVGTTGGNGKLDSLWRLRFTDA